MRYKARPAAKLVSQTVLNQKKEEKEEERISDFSSGRKNLSYKARLGR